MGDATLLPFVDVVDDAGPLRPLQERHPRSAVPLRALDDPAVVRFELATGLGDHERCRHHVEQITPPVEAVRRVGEDEIGRGTSTYDGLAIAWAVAEHLHDATRCRAIFATHYHELCELADRLPNAANYNIAAKEHDDRMVLLHQLVPGGSNRSYGLAVARLAGVPPVVLARAKAKLRELETRAESSPAPQMPLFEAPPAPDSEVEATLRALDVERMTPVDALVTLARLRDLARRQDE